MRNRCENIGCVNRQTAASLAKLCLQAAEGSPSEREGPPAVQRRVDARLALCDHHAALPRDLRLQHGLDDHDSRVYAPEELVQVSSHRARYCSAGYRWYQFRPFLATFSNVCYLCEQMYIECESKSLTEYDYKKALDLTDYIADMERRDDLRLRVYSPYIHTYTYLCCAFTILVHIASDRSLCARVCRCGARV